MARSALVLIGVLAAASWPTAAPTQVRLEVAAGISGSADMGSRSPRLAAQAAAVFSLGTQAHSLGVEAGYWGNAGNETTVMLRLVPGDPIPPLQGTRLLGPSPRTSSPGHWVASIGCGRPSSGGGSASSSAWVEPARP